MDLRNYGKWIAVLDARNQGVYLTAMIALSVLVWLVLVNYAYPKYMPAFRVALLACYALSLVIGVVLWH